MSKEDKEFLELCGDMGFWFDNVLGNDELMQRYYNLTQEREEEHKNLESDHNILIDEMYRVQKDMSKLVKKESDARKRFANVIKEIKNAIKKYKGNSMFALDDKSNDAMLELIKGDYGELIGLRNKVKNDDAYFEEDTQTIDHNLDNMELLLEILYIINKGGKKVWIKKKS